ncbi:MAG: HAD-IIIA family hydrolase [Clostridium sp.]|nr:HAD-IIIA family hydrolase [Clostridium sp.]
MIKAVFIDRDGTLGGSEVVTLPNEFSLYSNTKRALDLLKGNNIKIVAFTNQPDISRGLCKQEDFENELYGFGFDDLCICPHTNEDNCECRKPKTKMLQHISDKYKISLNDCFVIGDRWSDMVAGMNAGCKVILVKTGAGRDAVTKYKDKWDINRTEKIADDILDAATYILSYNSKNIHTL